MDKVYLVESFIVANSCFKEVKNLCESREVDMQGEKGNLKVLRTINGPMGYVGEATGNGRTYTKDVMESALGNVKGILEARSLLGQLDHPEKEPKLSDVSHIITGLWFENHNSRTYLYGTWEIVDTPKGQILNNLYEAKAGIGTSYRGYGNVDDRGYVTEYDFKGVDAVFDPSAGTYILEKDLVSESKEINESREKINEEIETMKKNLEEFKASIKKTISDEVEKLKENDSHISKKVSVLREFLTSPADMMHGIQIGRGEEKKEDDAPKGEDAPAHTEPKLPASAHGNVGVDNMGKGGTHGKIDGAMTKGSMQGKIEYAKDVKASPAEMPKVDAPAHSEPSLPKTAKGEVGNAAMSKGGVHGTIEYSKENYMGDLKSGKFALVEQDATLVVSKESGTPQLYRVSSVGDDKVVLTAVGGEVELPKSEYEKKKSAGIVVEVPEQNTSVAVEVPTMSIEPPPEAPVLDEPTKEEKKAEKKGEKEEETEETKEAYTKKLESALLEVRDYALNLEKVVYGMRDYAWKAEGYAEKLEKTVYELRDYALNGEKLSEGLKEKFDKSVKVIEDLRDYALKLEKVSEELVQKRGKVIIENDMEVKEIVQKAVDTFPVLNSLKEELLNSSSASSCEEKVRKYVSLFENNKYPVGHVETTITERKETRKYGSGERLLGEYSLQGWN